ncbi:hypothetical protein KGF56_003870 [Candida oxycetoniae]|uniref:Uncharacterized protein n=1 Tax=Candida oxycetoniae TaxID=497107 RepID=A0AAI9SUS1_9ASCO|nr:uncharacterized protein KGF56_003870 [Candida oxycetoniae]KAI3403282.1 hypothetical protein KGF56_003870 [Candida oxycetoniae]
MAILLTGLEQSSSIMELQDIAQEGSQKSHEGEGEEDELLIDGATEESRVKNGDIKTKVLNGSPQRTPQPQVQNSIEEQEQGVEEQEQGVEEQEQGVEEQEQGVEEQEQGVEEQEQGVEEQEQDVDEETHGMKDEAQGIKEEKIGDIDLPPLHEIVGGSSIRRYLNQHLTRHLLDGLKEVGYLKPRDPLKYLGEFLIARSLVQSKLEEEE